MANRGCVADAFLERFWRALGRQKVAKSYEKLSVLGAVFDQKSKERHPKRHPKIDAEKVKTMPKGPKMMQQWMPKS